MIDALVLNYNDVETTIKYIKSIEKFSIVRKIIVVDNCSTDSSFEILSNYITDKIDVIKTNRNGGYGAGNNYGIKYLVEKYNSEYILLSNPDVIVESNTLEKLEIFLRDNLDFIIAAPFMLNKNRKKQINTAFRIPGLIDYIFSFELVWSKWISKNFYKDIFYEKEEIKEVDGVSGSLFLMDASKMLKYGMYDENIFLYCEEISLAFKLKNSGLKTALLLQETFIHNHSVSISKTYTSEIKKHELLMKSKLYVIKKYYNAPQVLYCLALIMSKISLIEIWLWALIKRKNKCC